MKTTKTIEVEICDQCGDEMKYRHLEACVGCGKEICTNCVHRFSVVVKEHTPHRYDFGHGPRWSSSTQHVQDFAYHGNYCSPCSNRIGEVLRTARLAKTPTEPEQTAVLDSAMGSIQ